jgi:uncharacterized protein with HEPN domain
MPSSDPARRLQDILDHIAALKSFTLGVTLEDFAKDPMRAFAAIRALEVISEASRRLPDSIKQAHPEIEWKQIAAAGNLYRHEYDNVDYELIWQTIQSDLDPLAKVAEEGLQRLGR